jgi:hypothetical protein
LLYWCVVKYNLVYHFTTTYVFLFNTSPLFVIEYYAIYKLFHQDLSYDWARGRFETDSWGRYFYL